MPFKNSSIKAHPWLWKYDVRHQSRKCSAGHRWARKYMRYKRVLAWVKICKRCERIESISGKFNEDGVWVRGHYIKYLPDGSMQVVQEEEKAKDAHE